MTYLQLQSLIYEMTKTNSTSLPVATLNLYTQPAEDRVVSLIMQADGRWQFDDKNYTDATYGTTTLVSGQQDYSLSTSHIRITGIAVKDKNGNYATLEPIDPDDFGGIDRAEYYDTAGMPQCYDKQGASIFLYPPPDNGVSVTLSAGLKIYFQRGPLHFDYTLGTFTDATGTTGSTPGFNLLYHDLIAYWAAYNYCVANALPMANGFLTAIQLKEAQLIKDYSKRDKDDRAIITMRGINNFL